MVGLVVSDKVDGGAGGHLVLLRSDSDKVLVPVPLAAPLVILRVSESVLTVGEVLAEALLQVPTVDRRSIRLGDLPAIQ